MDNLIVAIAELMLGSFVVVVGMLFVLGLADEFKQRGSFEPFNPAAGFSSGRQAKLLSVTKLSRRAVAQNTEHAKAA